MRNEKRNIRREFKQKLGLWLLLISAGVVAYGIGLYEGSMFRMSRNIASIQKPVPVEIKTAEAGFVGPVLPSSTPSNTAPLKSRSK